MEQFLTDHRTCVSFSTPTGQGAPFTEKLSKTQLMTGMVGSCQVDLPPLFAHENIEWFNVVNPFYRAISGQQINYFIN